MDHLPSVTVAGVATSPADVAVPDADLDLRTRRLRLDRARFRQIQGILFRHAESLIKR